MANSSALKLPINILPDGFNIYDNHCLYPLFISLQVLKEWFPRSVIPVSQQLFEVQLTERQTFEFFFFKSFQVSWGPAASKMTNAL